MQTNLFDCPVIQAVVFTLILWILDQVEDDIVSIVIPAHAGIQIIRLRASLSGSGLSFLPRIRYGVNSSENPVLLRITLPCRLRLLMRINLFNGPVIQTVVFTLIPWILDQVEDDKCDGGVIIPLLLSFPRTRESSVIGDYHKGLSSEDYFLQLTLISIVSSSV